MCSIPFLREAPNTVNFVSEKCLAVDGCILVCVAAGEGVKNYEIMKRNIRVVVVERGERVSNKLYFDGGVIN